MIISTFPLIFSDFIYTPAFVALGVGGVAWLLIVVSGDDKDIQQVCDMSKC